MEYADGHIPVLVEEVLGLLRCRPGGCYLDCTVGAGGHAEAMLRASEPDGRVIAIDRDESALESARLRLRPFGSRAVFLHGDFRRMSALLNAQGVDRLDGIVFDLGISSLQLSDPERGFSFQLDGPLDMRMDRSSGPTAADLVNRLREDELAELIHAYGEERWSRRIARAIVRSRESGPVRTTGELAEIIRRAYPASGRKWPLNPATRTFQALRIAVNRELEGLSEILEEAFSRLCVGGRLAVIAFHSLEDRIVKHTFRKMAVQRPRVAEILTKKPIRPTAGETAANPRSRSAKLRGIERTA